MTSCGNVVTAISHPAAAVEPDAVEGEEDEGEGQTLVDERAHDARDDEPRQ